MQRETFLYMPEAIVQQSSVTHSLVTLPKKIMKAVWARCRKDYILVIFFVFLSMDFLFCLFVPQMFSKETYSSESVSLPNMYLCDLSCLGGLCLMFSLIQMDLKGLCTESSIVRSNFDHSVNCIAQKRGISLKGLYYFWMFHFAVRQQICSICNWDYFI